MSTSWHVCIIVKRKPLYLLELNFSKGLALSDFKVTITSSVSRSKLKLSGGIFLKLRASMPFGFWIRGVIGGVQCLSRAKFIDLKKGCALISEAPARHPSRLFSSLCKSFLIKLLQLLEICDLYGEGCSPN